MFCLSGNQSEFNALITPHVVTKMSPMDLFFLIGGKSSNSLIIDTLHHYFLILGMKSIFTDFLIKVYSDLMNG